MPCAPTGWRVMGGLACGDRATSRVGARQAPTRGPRRVAPPTRRDRWRRRIGTTWPARRSPRPGLQPHRRHSHSPVFQPTRHGQGAGCMPCAPPRGGRYVSSIVPAGCRCVGPFDRISETFGSSGQSSRGVLSRRDPRTLTWTGRSKQRPVPDHIVAISPPCSRVSNRVGPRGAHGHPTAPGRGAWHAAGCPATS